MRLSWATTIVAGVMVLQPAICHASDYEGPAVAVDGDND